MAIASTSANATVYEFIPDQQPGISADLDLDDAVASYDHSAWSGRGDPADGDFIDASGDPDFRYFAATGIDSFRLVPYPKLYGSISLELSFDKSGQLIGGLISTDGSPGGVGIDISPGRYTASLSSAEPCNFPTTCAGSIRVSASPVPEPVSAAMLGTGLLGLAFARSRQRPT